MTQDFSIQALLKLAEGGKYATTTAGFKAIDLLDQIELPQKLQSRKAAVQALHVLSGGMAQWDYITDEQRVALREELEERERVRLEEVFGNSLSRQSGIAEESKANATSYHFQEAPQEELVAVGTDIASGFSIENEQSFGSSPSESIGTSLSHSPASEARAEMGEEMGMEDNEETLGEETVGVDDSLREGLEEELSTELADNEDEALDQREGFTDLEDPELSAEA